MQNFNYQDFIKDGLSLSIFKLTDTQPISTHTHDFTEIIYVISGRAEQTVNDKKYEVRRGDLLFINYDSTHSFRPQGEFSYFNICFDPELIYRRIISRENALDLLSLSSIDLIMSDTSQGLIHFSGEERAHLEAMLEDMLDEHLSSRRERGAVLESYMNILVTRILRRIYPEEQADSDFGELGELLSYIDENLDKPLSLPELAQRCFYNPSYFSRIFKEKFGITLGEYVARQRARAALRLLTESDLTVDTIAGRCGYTDKSGLYRAIKKHFGEAPSGYRRGEKSKNPQP